MRNLRYACLALCLNLCGLAQIPTLPLLTQPPVIDGKPGDPSWEQALTTTDFKTFEGNASPKLMTKAWIGHTQDTLYMACKTTHHDITQFTNQCTAHDGEVYRDDECEIFFDFRGKRHDYLQVIANVRGTIFDAYVNHLHQSDLLCETGARAKGSIGKDYYYIELAIPKAALRLGENETGTVGICLARAIAFNRNTASAWGKFHAPTTWRHFTLPGKCPLALQQANYHFSAGKQTFKIRIKNQAENLLRAVPVINGKKHPPIAFQPNQVKTFDFTDDLQEGQDTTEQLLLQDPSGNLILQWEIRGIPKPVFSSVFLNSPIIFTQDNLVVSAEILSVLDDDIGISVKDQQNRKVSHRTCKPRKGLFQQTLSAPCQRGSVTFTYGGKTVTLPFQRIESPWEP